MDSITHILAPALFSEPDTILPSGRLPAPAWRVRAALALGALLPDADGMMGWFDRAMYARYHRVWTHSLGGMVVVVALSVPIARWWPSSWAPRRWRNDGWGGAAGWRRLVRVAALAVGVHWVLDWVTAWQVQPFWPFWRADLSLGRLNSLDPVALSFTVAFWAAQHLALVRGRRRLGWGLAWGWLAVFGLYVWLRPIFGPPAYT